MCAGYTISKNIERIKERFNVEFPDQFLPRYNARPSQLLPIITSDDPTQVVMAHWGLKPEWLKAAGLKHEIINTRKDSLLKHTFLKDLKNRRCLIVADGFIEWEKNGKLRIPHRYGVNEYSLFTMAGIYEIDSQGLRFSIITTESNKVVEKVHNRMPAILSPTNENLWLQKDPNEINYLDLIQTFSENGFNDSLISSLVNSPKNDSKDLLDESNLQKLF